MDVKRLSVVVALRARVLAVPYGCCSCRVVVHRSFETRAAQPHGITFSEKESDSASS
jgi:hypothetical protein